MPAVLQLSRVLVKRPPALEVPGLSLRNYQQVADIAAWLELRRRAFARERCGVRDWNAADFEREFFDKPWWRADAMWLCEAIAGDGSRVLVGTATLARRVDKLASRPVIHWLAVLPSMRRRGIGRWLITTIETVCWDAGDREIALETHESWAAASQFYAALGYRAEA